MMHTDDLLDIIAASAVNIRKQDELSDGFVKYRDEKIRQALRRGVPVSALCEAAGLSYRRINQIRNQT